jgi:SAM-dependent methyltransferase
MTAAAIHLVPTPACPVCEEPAGATFLTRAEVAAELRARHRFFPRGGRDLTEAVLGIPAAILRCTHCGVLVRDDAPDESAFRDDRYDDRELELLHATHVQAFAAKELDYRSLLPPDARVIEVGSYAGGFLTAAARWGWRASGADIGRDPVRFCRRLGLDVQCRPLEECNIETESLDAVFIWNCFEQIARPISLLGEAHRALRTGGLLVIRVPDADFYIRRRQLSALAHNGLLGWPHRFGYDAAAVRRLAQKQRFAFVRTLRRPAVRPLREARMSGETDHGWIELTFRKE